MPNYCVNAEAQDNGDHEVHEQGCTYWPSAYNVRALGYHLTCQSAVTAAKKAYPYWKINGCYFCSRLCHTT